MKILVLGSGGREHAIAWKCAQSKQVEEVFVIPGNPGMKRDEKISVHPNISTEHSELISFVRENDIEFTIVGPENLLDSGIVDSFRNEGLFILGPTLKATQVESSKSFSKKIMDLAGIKTAEYEVFENSDSAISFIETCTWDTGIVVKCDGLAAGKGVVVCEDKEHAKRVVDEFINQDSLGIKNQKIILEERLVGKEVSSFFLCDGEEAFFLGDACDYKRLSDNDQGPNTGGMGTYSPADWLENEHRREIQENIVLPFLKQMKVSGITYTGILFAGLMITNDGPYVIEFNARLGDPETQVLLPRIKSDIVNYFFKAAQGRLSELSQNSLEYIEKTTLHLVKAAHGYPGTQGIAVRKGDEIKMAEDRLSTFEKNEKGKVFFAGVKEENGNLYTSGGRVLGITAFGLDREKARECAYMNHDIIDFSGCQYRNDIGL